MAQRSSTPEKTPANEILSILVGMTKDAPKVTLRALELESATLVSDLLPLLDELESAQKINSSGRGDDTLIWVLDSSPATPKKTRRTKAQMDAAKKEAAEQNAANSEPVESQEPVTPETPVIAAVEPVQGADGENITVPVSEGSTERRELDASKGESLISEDVVKGGKFVPLVTSAPDATVRLLFVLSEYIDTLKSLRDKASQDRETWTPLDDVDVPKRPEGVNENTWFHVFNSQGVTERDTYSARLWWAERAASQMTEA